MGNLNWIEPSRVAFNPVVESNYESPQDVVVNAWHSWFNLDTVVYAALQIQ